MGSSIFLSYRRSDSQAWTGRLTEGLTRYYGPSRVYRDLDSNRAAKDFEAQIEAAMSDARALIAVMGPTWASATNELGAVRLSQSDDLVRTELERGLATDIAIVPVLVGGAVMPSAKAIPASLSPVTRLQALRMSDEDWAYDFARLIEVLEGFGLHPARPSILADKPEDQRAPKIRRFDRTLKATRRRALDAAVVTAEVLRYKGLEVDTASAVVRFTARRWSTTVKVVDAEPGFTHVFVEFPSPRLAAAGAAGAGFGLFMPVAFAIPAGVAGWRYLEKRYATGLLDNIESVLDGRGVGEDSARLPGVERRERGSDQV